MTEKKHSTECAAIIELINSYLRELNEKDLRVVVSYVRHFPKSLHNTERR